MYSGRLSTKTILKLIPHLCDLNDADDVPISFLTHLNDHLNYPPSGDDLDHAQAVIHALSTCVLQWPAKHVLSLLRHVSMLHAWIRDAGLIVTKYHYESYVSVPSLLKSEAKRLDIDYSFLL